MLAATLFEVTTYSPEETIEFGRRLALELTRPCLVLLEGELGTGKTTLVKGIAAGMGAASPDEVSSPSFTLVHEYGRDRKVYHADLYRIEGSRDFATLGMDDLVDGSATVLIEWGEKFPEDLPVPALRIRLEHLGGDRRRILVKRDGE
jgi:tRNA threonylcarbamoyladenosine biosynthesis protein TsaE